MEGCGCSGAIRKDLRGLTVMTETQRPTVWYRAGQSLEEGRATKQRHSGWGRDGKSLMTGAKPQEGVFPLCCQLLQCAAGRQGRGRREPEARVKKEPAFIRTHPLQSTDEETGPPTDVGHWAPYRPATERSMALQLSS